ncbi:type II pantothenate kinase [Ruminococcaceae bacterium YRB3002]|nr:type II pantothenate kinase [Ruminococcaceae bacterium YRB3002]
MGMIIGLDVGGSTTKIVGMDNGSITAKAVVKATDPVTSAFGAVGKIINDNGLRLSDIDRINITGVGAGFPAGAILGIDTVEIKEFDATGRGGLYLSGLDHAVVVSLGTGTAYLDASKEGIKHIIGSGVGGGTLVGLCNSILGMDDAEKLSELAESGNISAVDLTIGDITKSDILGLPMTATASNFGKAADDLTREDKAAGIFNLVFQAIGSMAVLSSRVAGIRDIVFTGQIADFKQCRQVLDSFHELYDVNFIVPEGAKFGTAIGACLSR